MFDTQVHFKISFFNEYMPIELQNGKKAKNSFYLKEAFSRVAGNCYPFFRRNVLIPSFKHISLYKFASERTYDPNLHILRTLDRVVPT